ncbi:MAG: type II toxin-antitoxin system death-on-curing family toxin [Deltaproteobacteria bacterium]|nr:type II toxin-antitoxin system death-on-curing family toxin [Deltaproteobacteria bacterium]
MEYLDIQHVLAMHEVLIEKYGGLHGVRDNGLLDSALSQPQQSAFGEDIFTDIPSKAAAYAYYLSENQPFLDGNKRIATAASVTFLRLNDYDLNALEKDVYDIIMDLANKHLTRESLVKWFQKNSAKKDEERANARKIS